jgi:sister chromatid cohesion protein PDS5
MPSTRKRVSAAAEVSDHEEADEELHESLAGLQFNESLTWRAGKPIAVAELLRRLQALSQELRSLDQEDAQRESLLPAAKDLASSNLLSHKDKGVRAWTACCVVDMFRLCAPKAPYTAAQLKVGTSHGCRRTRLPC